MNSVKKALGRPWSRLLAAAVMVSGVQAHADDNSEVEKLKAQVQELDQKLRILDRKQEISAEELAAQQKAAPVVAAGDKGFGFKSADGQFEYRLRGLLQIDYRDFSGDAYPTAVSGFLARRIRPTFEGTLWGKYGFRFTPEFGESKAGVIDAYVDIRHNPAAQIRIGKFKPFVGLERLQSGSDIKFIERSYVSNNILPNRDLGLAVHGDVLDKRLNYAVGVFNGVVDGGENTTSQDLNSQKEFSARVFATPFADRYGPLQGLGFGLAATTGRAIGTANATNLPTYRSPGQANSFFTYANNTVAFGSRTRWSPQAYYYRGPFGVLAEYAVVSQEIANGAARLTVKNSALHIAASWLVTGEDASFLRVKPAKPFRLGADGGWGAFELLARYQAANIDRVLFDSTTFINTAADNAWRATTFSVGVNWYLNEFSKVALNYDRTDFDGGSNSGTRRLDGKSEHVVMARYQLGF